MCNAVLAIRKMSVRLSVCQTREFWQNERDVCPHFYTGRKNDHPSFLTRRMLGVGRLLLYQNIVFRFHFDPPCSVVSVRQLSYLFYLYIRKFGEELKASSANSGTCYTAQKVYEFYYISSSNDVDVDGVNERRPKKLCPYHLITSQYVHLLELLIQHVTPTSGSLQLCSEIIYNILIMPEFIHSSFKCVSSIIGEPGGAVGATAPPRADKNFLGVIHRENLQVHPKHTKCTLQPEQESIFRTCFAVLGRFGAWITSFWPSFAGDD